MSTDLEKLRKRLSETDLGGGGGTGFWNVPDGDSNFRILPLVGAMDVFYQEVGTHFIPGMDSPINCPWFTTMTEYACPICEIATLLGQSRNQNDKDLADKLRVNKRYWMNVVVRELDDDEGMTGEGPYIFTPGPMIMKQLNSLIMSKDYGDPSLVTPSADGGYDTSVNKKGKKKDTKYSITPRRLLIPLHPNPSQVENWLKGAAEILIGHLTDDPDEDEEVGKGYRVKLLPYERIVEETGISPDMNVEAYRSDASLTSKGSDGQASAETLKDRLRKAQPATISTRGAETDKISEFESTLFTAPQPVMEPETSPVSEPGSPQSASMPVVEPAGLDQQSIEETPQPDAVGAEIRSRWQRRKRR